MNNSRQGALAPDQAGCKCEWGGGGVVRGRSGGGVRKMDGKRSDKGFGTKPYVGERSITRPLPVDAWFYNTA